MTTTFRNGVSLLVAGALSVAALIAAGHSPALAEPTAKNDPAAKGAPKQQAPKPTASKKLEDTFGLEVADRDDPVAGMLKLTGGLRIMKIEPGSIATKVVFPGTRRALGRGDFVLKVRVKGIDDDPSHQKDSIMSPDQLKRECRRARRLIWQQPEHKGTLLVDVFTQAGYNLDDWKTLTFEAPLDLSAEPEPAPLEPEPKPAPDLGGTT